jgi:geranylgeranyl diphosphate synthase type I
VKSGVDATLSDLKSQIDGTLKSFVDAEVIQLEKIGSELTPVGESLSHFILDSGKRLRPIFAAAGFLGSGKSLKAEVIKGAAALELIHVCALIHDDLMDGSDTRRGAPSIHKEFEYIHRQEHLAGNAEQYGASAAILMGDLALVWASKALLTSGIDDGDLLRSLPLFNELQVELMAGQFLDVHEQTSHTSSLERSRKIARYKSGKYTIERPLHFGAALADESKLESIYTNYGIPLGEAFQLRDDILGVFGEPDVTGKPAGDDLLEGKRTALIAKSYELAGASGALVLSQVLGNRKATPELIEKAKGIITESGALEFIENLIDQLVSDSLNSIKGLPNEELLFRLAEVTTKRNS